MTKTGKEVLAIPFHDGLKWFRDVGEPFKTEGMDERIVEKMRAKGYLVSAAEFKARTNPEAARAQQQIEAQQTELGSLYALFPGVSTVTGLQQAIGALRGQVPSAEQAEAHSSNATTITALQALYPDVAPGALLEAVKASRDGAARAVTLQALYASDGGTDLPGNFKKVGALKKLGLGTWEGLQGKSWQQLTAVEGVTDEDARDIAQKVEAHFAQPE